MSNKTKILSELSKIIVESMSSFSDIKKEIETIVKMRVEKIINKMNLVKRDEFEVLKEIVQKLEAKLGFSFQARISVEGHTFELSRGRIF